MTTLEDALDYARQGWRVIPILPGSKRPALTRWTEQATTDTATIKEWWDGHDDYGVGIATGPTSGFWVLDVDDFDSFRDLEQRYEMLPDTRTSITGSGGFHFLFRWPADGRDIRNDAGRRLGPGLDVRGDGGQIVAPPSIHPNGNTYQWDAGLGDDIAEAPEWLLELVCAEPATETTERTVAAPTDRPGDRWAASTTWGELLERDGWQLHHVDRDGEHHWTRPGKELRDGTSATTGYKGSDVLKVFTSSMRAAGLDEEQTYTKLGYLASTRFDGDHSAAAAALAAQGWSSPSDDPFDSPEFHASVAQLTERTLEELPDLADPDADNDDEGHWQFVDLDPILDGTFDPPVPTLLPRNDGTGLIYRGRVHSIAGEPGGGKTWIALHLIADTLTAGGTAMLIDYEDTPASAVSRLRTLGVDDQAMRDRFAYVRPDGPLIDRQGRVAGHTMARLEALAADVVVIDSIGESLAAEGFKPNDDDQVTRWFRLLPRRLARNGSAVLGLDHRAKNKDDRGLWAIGSQRKLAAIDGAAYVADVKVAPTKTADGHVRLICAKDRHGTHQRDHMVADVHIRNLDGGVRLHLAAPATTFRPTVLMERVSRFLEETPTASKNMILTAVKGKHDSTRLALDVLLAEGYVRKESGGRGGEQWSSVEPFRAPDEMAAFTGQSTASPRPDRVPTASPDLALDADHAKTHTNRARPTASRPDSQGDRVPPRPSIVENPEIPGASPRPDRVPGQRDAVPDDRVPRVPDPLRSRGPAGTLSASIGTQSEHRPRPRTSATDNPADLGGPTTAAAEIPDPFALTDADLDAGDSEP